MPPQEAPSGPIRPRLYADLPPMVSTVIVHVTVGDGVATWIVAVATAALFVTTGFLFLSTRRMVGVTASEVAIERDRLAAAQRPHVYAVTLDEWVTERTPYLDHRARQVIPLANAGPGIAHNVTGLLRFADGIFVPIFPVTIQPGERLDARLNWGGDFRGNSWKNAHGFLAYRDVAGVAWVTEYSIRESNSALFFEFEWSGLLSDFGNIYERMGILLGTVVMRGEMTNTLDRILGESMGGRRPS